MGTLVAGCAEAPVQPSENMVPSSAGLSTNPRYIVVFKEGKGNPGVTARNMVAPHGGQVRSVYRRALNGFSARLSPAAVESLRRHPGVAFVEAEVPIGPFGHTVQTSAPPNLDRIDQRVLPLNGSYGYISTGQGVTVYVLDSGVRVGEADFEGRAAQVKDFYSNDGANGRDCRDHGTGVAALIAGRTYGVAKRAIIRSIRILPCVGNGSTGDIVDALEWVQDWGVRPSVVNISVGGGESQAVDLAVKSTVEAGWPVIAAAGNNSGSACDISPAGAPEALTVGNIAVNSTSKYPSSNYGSCVDIWAPGNGSRTLSNTGDFSGTSAAAPHVAGVAALYLQNHPTAASGAVINAIVQGSSVNTLTNLGAGSPNRMLHAVSGSMSVQVSGPSSVSSASATTWTAVPKGGVGHYTYRWEVVQANGTRTQHGTGASMTTIPGYNWGVFTVIAYVKSNGSNEVMGLRGVNNQIPGSCRFGCP